MRYKRCVSRGKWGLRDAMDKLGGFVRLFASFTAENGTFFVFPLPNQGKIIYNEGAIKQIDRIFPDKQ